MSWERKKIGFWRGKRDGLMGLILDLIESLPDPRTMIDLDWSEEEREVVASYLDAGERVAKYFGYSWCRFECEARGTVMGTADLSDGVYLWPEGFSHYVRVHQVRPPEDFVQHVLGQKR